METTIELTIGPGFGRWLAELGRTVVITTYQAGKIVFVGHDGQQIKVAMRDLFAPMGLAIAEDRCAVALRDRIEVYRGASAEPELTVATGDIRAHEIAFGREGLWVVNTRLSCLGLASGERAFEPRWRPKFVSALAPEDRCHLSGVAMEDGAPAYATAHAATNTPNGWRDEKLGGGVVIDVARGEPLASGFTMPHSPRVERGALWLLDSGHGVLARVDRKTGARTPVARVPGFARGLCFVGGDALVGLSRIRQGNVFAGMPIAARHANLACGVAVVDPESGAVKGVLRFTAGCEEIFDVGVLPADRGSPDAGWSATIET